MLKGIDPVLRGELLKALDEMGHGQQLALVDRNFAAYNYTAPVVDLGAINAARAAQAIFSVFPLDQFVDTPLTRMAYDGDPAMENDVHQSVREIANASAGADWPWQVIDRQVFYQRAQDVSLIIRCLEDAPYACFIFHKGII